MTGAMPAPPSPPSIYLCVFVISVVFRYRLVCVPVQMCLCSGTNMSMFRYMPRAGYRQGEKRVDVWLSTAGHAHLRALADGWECSLSDAVARLVREKVSSDADADAGSRRGVLAAADGSRSGSDTGGFGGLSGGVVAGDVADWDAIWERGVAAKTPTVGNTVLQPAPDPLEDIA